MRTMKDIESKINQLTPGLVEELDRYLDYLINKRVVRKPRKLRQDWAGGLKDVNMSSIELQKKALDWRQK
jgi:5'-deoxynucleotidase YfbR-like HD superfamily hydrolase